jgi:hypothetical protein
MRLNMFGIGLCAALICNAASADKVMKVAGTFAVGKDGQATYTLPIKLPSLPEEVGINLALTYNSQAGAGLMGKGWNISGLSMISRCDLTVAQDGISDPVHRGTQNPRYCLDGQRLILDPATANASTKIYRDEFEKFSRITATAETADGDVFIVETKSGIKLVYIAYLLTLPGQSATVKWWWPLREVRDRYGSIININYIWDTSQKMLRPSLIKLPDMTSYRKLADFKYDVVNIPGAAEEHYYQDQLMTLRQEYLSAVTSYGTASRDQRLKEYKFTYEADPITHIPNLTTLEECAGFCHPLVKFTYSSAGLQPHFQPTFQSDVLDWGNAEGRDWVDMNGDGKSDFCRVIGPAGAFRLACTLSTGSGFGATATSEVVDAGVGGSRKWVDVNADGFTDFCRVTGTPGTYRLACTFGSASGFGNTVSSVVDVGNEMQNAKWHDIRRDGKISYCRYDSTSQFRCTTLTGTAFVEEAGVAGSGVGKFDVVDVVAKAMPYRCVRQTGKLFCVTLDGTKQSNIAFGYNITVNPNYGWWADINGDGHADYCQPADSAATSTMQCGRSTGTKVVGSNIVDYIGSLVGTNVTIGGAANAKWVDVNGGRTADYCRVIGAPGSHKAACSEAENLVFRDAMESEVLDPGQNEGQEWVDVVGDGSKAFCRVIGSANLADSRVACTPFVSAGGGLVQIDNGLGASTKIEYKPLTDSSVYTKGVGAVYPLNDVQNSTYVVSKVDLSNGQGGYVSTTYRYGAALKDVTGRGGMGVRWREETNHSNGVVTRTVYRQDLPFTGLPAQTTVLLAGYGNEGLLSDTTYEYGCKDFVSTSGCTVAMGARYFPYLASSVSKSWDLDGTAMPTITTTQEIDNWGSVTKSKRTASDGIQTETVNTYKNISTPALWLPGLLEKSVVTKSAPSN